MNWNNLLVVCPRGGAGEIFAGIMAKKFDKLEMAGRLGFAYPYLPDFVPGSASLLQHVAAIIRDGSINGVGEFIFVDTGVRKVLKAVWDYLPNEVSPIIYDVIDEARAYFTDPQERPLWVDRWGVMSEIEGFETLYSRDRQDVKELLEEVAFRVRGVTGGNSELVPQEFKADLMDENVLRTRSAQLLFKLAEISNEKGIILGNIDLAMALTRYVDEEFRKFIEQCRFVQLADVLVERLL